MSRVETLKKKLAELGAAPKMSLGQNFLISDHVIGRIIQEVKGCQPQRLIEVGPGLGALTEDLIAMGVPLMLIEMDRIFAEYWRSRGQAVVEEDALNVDWPSLLNPSPVVLVSNLPYQISSSLVVELSPFAQRPSHMVLMFQKEVAQRLQAKPSTPDYGFLTVVAQIFWEMDLVLEAGPNDFFPSPKVSSRVLHFRQKAINIEDPERLIGFLKVAFSQRRKLLQKNLRAVAPLDWAAHLQRLGVSDKVRAEELSPGQFVELYNSWQRTE